MRLLLDQGLPRSSAEILRNKGWDIQHTGEIGMSRATDRQILEYARDEQRIVITLDSDFHAILAVENLDSPSVVRIRQEGLRGPELVELVEKISSRIGQQLEKGAMATITEKTMRIRKIPLNESDK
jgi:predicted nuclease of predicted toxin-antitoxin system